MPSGTRENNEDGTMILAIRISGQVGLSHSDKTALDNLRLRRKYAAVLLKDNEQNRSMLVRVRNLVAYGKVDSDTLKELIEKRGQSLDSKKVDSSKVSSELSKKSLEELGLKPFFRLHPPRGGIESKKHFGVGKGVLGDNKEKINDLVRRML